MSLPKNRDDLRRRWQAGERFHFLFFYGHKPPEHGVDASCFSQWFNRSFEIDDHRYPTAEHWMMAEKARLFGDSEMLEAILNAPTPKEAKAYGRKVQDFDLAIWDENKFDIVRLGNLAKFEQHPDLRNYLLATSNYRPSLGNSDSRTDSELVQEKPLAYITKTSELSEAPVILVEAAGRDVVWGIGLGRSNPKAQNPLTWRGRNLLGFALTSVREELANREYVSG